MQDHCPLWRIDSRTHSLIVGLDQDDSPFLIWFGEKLDTNLDADAVYASLDCANPKATLDSATPLSLFPQAATGYIGAPGLCGHRNGAAFAPWFKTDAVEVLDNALVFKLVDIQHALELTLTLELDLETSILSVSCNLTNLGEAYQLDWLASATLRLPDSFNEMLYLHGRWGKECQQARHSIGFNQIRLENFTGRTSHEKFPGVMMGTSGFSFDSGMVLGMQLAWSGNHRTLVERLSCGTSYVQTGAALLPGEVCLQQGESYQTPKSYFSAGFGLNTVAQQFHRFARQHVLPAWTRQPRPVHANSWEALYFDHRTPQLLELIDAAFENGAERFVLDDGWFNGRRDDTSSLGDWEVDANIYPDGLHPIVKHVRDKGMQFGLWFEPEMVSPNSDLYRQHPEWVLSVQNQPVPLARHQLTLNIALPEVSDYLYSRISSLISEYEIDYIKWDMNRNLVQAGNGQGACSVQQPNALYALLNRIIKFKPDIEIETCASGGARADLGVLQHTGRVWTSDSIDPIDRLHIHQGFNLFLPPEVMGAHVGHNIAHVTGRSTSMNTRALVALQGQFGFELDARALDTGERTELSHYTQLYKQHRDWLSESTLWQLDCRNSDLLARGYVSNDKTKSLWTVFATNSLAETTPERLVMRGLEADKNYRVVACPKSVAAVKQYGIHLPSWTLGGCDLSGTLLMHTGLSLPVLPAQSGFLIRCHQ